jgi:hypothetical protein
MVAAELVSKHPEHGHLMRDVAMGAVEAQLCRVLRKAKGPGGGTYLIPCGKPSDEVVQHAVESLGSAVQEYGIVQVLQTLAVAKQLPKWSAPSAGARDKAFRFWDFCMNAAIGCAERTHGGAMELKGLHAAIMMVSVAMPRVFPGVMDALVGQSLLHKDASNAAVRQCAAVAEKLKLWRGSKYSYNESLEAPLQCKSILLDMVPVSFCCCNTDCTSLQGISELGLVFKAEGSSTSSSGRQKGCRPIGGGVCSGCGVSCYCSRKCQRQHWAAGHKETCGALASLQY